MKNLLAIFKLIRPATSFTAGAAVWVGAKLTQSEALYYQTSLASLAVFFLCGAAFVFNDLCDIEIDRINQPNRVLVRGELTKQIAFYLTIGFNLMALILSALVNNYLLGLTILTIAVFFLFNLKFKKISIIGNLLVAFLAGLTFLFGGIAVDPKLVWQFPGPLIGFVYAFLYMIVLMILIGLKHLSENRLSQRTSLLTKIGSSHSALLAMLIFSGLVILSYWPIFFGWYSSWYKTIIVYIVGLPVLCFLIIMWGNPTEKMLKVGIICLKFGMILYLLGLFLS